MKKNYYLLAMLLVSTLTIFSACGDDDDIPATPTPEVPDTGGDDTEGEKAKTATLDATAYNKWVYYNFSDGATVAHEIEPVAGTYSGDISIQVMGKDYGSVEDLKLEVGRLESDSVSLVLKDFNFGSYNMGDIAAGASIAADTLCWSLTGGQIVVNGMNVTCNGGIAGDSINLVMTIQPSGMPMPFVATYKGIVETRTGIDDTSFNWDIALHRYDVKTNGAWAVEMIDSEMDKVTTIPDSTFVADIKTDSLIIDNSGMMNNKVGYASSNINEVLNKGIEFDSKTMPPTAANWSMSNKIYVMKLKSGEHAKIKFTDYSNDADVKGHISFEYVYPFK